MLGQNCPVATPNAKSSRMSFSGHSGTPPPNQNPVKPGPSAEFHPCGESSDLTEEKGEEIPSKEVSDSDSDSESGSESCSDSDSHSESGSGYVVPSEESIPHSAFERNFI